MKKVIKESQLRQIIRESLVSIINEHKVKDMSKWPKYDEVKGVEVYIPDPSKCAVPADRDPQRLANRLIAHYALNATVDEQGGVHAYFETAGDAEEIWRECLKEPQFSVKVLQLKRAVASL